MRTREFIPLMPSIKRHGITENKKAELDALTNQVIDAQHHLEQVQAIVDSLTEKSQRFSAFLAAATVNKTNALANWNMVIQVVQSARDLMINSMIALDATA